MRIKQNGTNQNSLLVAKLLQSKLQPWWNCSACLSGIQEQFDHEVRWSIKDGIVPGVTPHAPRQWLPVWQIQSL